MTSADRIALFKFADAEPQRLDKFLVTCLPEFSRTRLQGLISEGRVEIDGIKARKAGQMIETHMEVKVTIPPAALTSLEAEEIPLDIVFENDELMVVNKPAGMVVHPAAGHPSGTLVNAALAHAPDMEGIGGELRPGVVHRLDKDTSGLILLAKNERIHRYLQDQFRKRQVEKTYLALVDGKPPTPEGRIEASIGRSQKERRRMAVVTEDKGRQATSYYTTLEQFEKHCFMEVKPVTGRTHQIRLHLAFVGCPIVGDTIYGLKRPTMPIKRHCLHAGRIKFSPSQEKEAITLEAPLPDDMNDLLTQLRNSNK